MEPDVAALPVEGAVGRASAESVPTASAKEPKKDGRARPKRDDVMVTARVGRTLRRRGDEALRRIGATPTELVNRAFEYVVETGELPELPSARRAAPGVRRIDSAMRERVMAFVDRATFAVPAGSIPDDYKQQVGEAIRAKYESLA